MYRFYLWISEKIYEYGIKGAYMVSRHTIYEDVVPMSIWEMEEQSKM